MDEFSDLIFRIRNNDSVNSEQLKPFLMAERLSVRLMVNIELAQAYLERGDVDTAQVFAERAWLFATDHSAVLPMYEAVMKRAGNLDALRSAYRRVGDVLAINGGFSAAYPMYLKSMYVFAKNGGGDLYEFDRDMLKNIHALASKYKFNPLNKRWNKGERKLRIAYLVFGAMHVNSVIVRILNSIADKHDHDRFEFAFFVPENSLVQLGGYANLQATIKSFSKNGHIVNVSNGTEHENILEACAHQIYEYSPDILVTSALLADLKQYYIAAMKPAPIVVGMTHGPPQQFSDHILDWSISWDPHALIDCMSNCTHVRLEVNLSDDILSESGRKSERSRWGLRDEQIVVVAAGRTDKFLKRSWWEAVFNVMRNNELCILVVVGIKIESNFIAEMLKDYGLVQRVKLYDWLNNYKDLLQISDIMIDTHPSGGGVTLMDGMAFGLPTITFKNDFMKLFDQTDWSPGESIVDIPELTAEHNDFEQFSIILNHLVNDYDYRVEMGAQCKEAVYGKRGLPERMVRSIEAIYENVAVRLLGNERGFDETRKIGGNEEWFEKHRKSLGLYGNPLFKAAAGAKSLLKRIVMRLFKASKLR